MTNTYRVAVSWSYAAVLEIEAASVEEAVDIALDRKGLPAGHYVVDSFAIRSVKDISDD